MINKTYGRIKDNKIIEYPVYDYHIKNRGHPLSWYTEVAYDIKPDVDEFHYLREHLSIVASNIFVRFELIPYTIDQVLSNIWKEHSYVQDNETILNFADIPLHKVNKVIELSEAYVTKKLNEFARTKRYEDIVSLTSFANSTNITYKQEAERGIYLRDTTWDNFYLYLAEVQSGTTTVPKSLAEIEARIPDLTW